MIPAASSVVFRRFLAENRYTILDIPFPDFLKFICKNILYSIDGVPNTFF
jgi:hypothetical protein